MTLLRFYNIRNIMITAVCAVALAFISTSTTYAGWVKGHVKSDGTYVNGFWRSDPNGLKYDNYSFDGDWSDAYNNSYFSSTRNYSSDWYKPTWVTQDDYQLGKSFYDTRSNYSTYSYDLYDYDYDYRSDPIYEYNPSYSYGYDYMDSISSYESPYSSYDNYASTPYSSSYSSPYSSSYDNSSSLYDNDCYSSLYSSCNSGSYTSPHSSGYDSYLSPYSSSYDSYSSPYSSSYPSPYSSSY